VASTPASERAASGPTAQLASVDPAIRRLFSDDEEFVNAGKQIRELITHPGWQHMRRVWGVMYDAQSRLLIAKVHEHARYADIAGSMRGLQIAAEAAGNLVEAAERVRRERERQAQEAQ
jgi:hypothetical protein